MKVVCIRLPAPVDGVEIDASPWVSVDNEYIVLGVLADFPGRIQLHLLADDGRSLAWFDSDCFLTVDAIPANWSARINDGGTLELAPPAWFADGFWESYYDGDPSSRESVDGELAVILGGSAP